ncbi:MAG: NUDIX domain-containing protein [Acidimicrobiia bacterium]|nr:NUDIX domain-containing protein [Acidimicrobiia bacterium]
MSWNWIRRAARVVALDQEGRIFLINASDPADPTKPAWWEIPGGGIDPGESSAHAVARELWEEGGIRDARIGPAIWTQHVSFTFAGLHFEQDEVIHIALCDSTTTRPPQGLELFEAMAFKGSRWWPIDELLASDEPTLPPRLRELLPDVVDGDLPDPPLHISEAPLAGDPFW